MKTISISIYTFDELSESSQKVALSYFHDLCVTDTYWFKFILQDAENVGIIIHKFDLDNYFIKLSIEDCYHTANLILQNKNDSSKIFLKAEALVNAWDKLVNSCLDGITLNKVAEHNNKRF